MEKYKNKLLAPSIIYYHFHQNMGPQFSDFVIICSRKRLRKIQLLGRSTRKFVDRKKIYE